VLNMESKKHILMDSECHRKLKVQASLNKRTLQEELNKLINDNIKDIGD